MVFWGFVLWFVGAAAGILALLSSATGIVDYDDEILSIVSDEVSAYFAGDKDVQTTANMIQSRVNLYVQEQR